MHTCMYVWMHVSYMCMVCVHAYMCVHINTSAYCVCMYIICMCGCTQHACFVRACSMSACGPLSNRLTSTCRSNQHITFQLGGYTRGFRHTVKSHKLAHQVTYVSKKNFFVVDGDFCASSSCYSSCQFVPGEGSKVRGQG